MEMRFGLMLALRSAAEFHENREFQITVGNVQMFKAIMKHCSGNGCSFNDHLLRRISLNEARHAYNNFLKVAKL